MSREQYQPPSLSQSSQAGAGAGGSSTNQGTFNITGSSSNPLDDHSRAVNYLCGDCDAKVALKKSDPIRCKECGYRVLYKERTTRMVQFEAR